MSHPPPDPACLLQWTTAQAAGTDRPRAWTGTLTTAATGERTLARSFRNIRKFLRQPCWLVCISLHRALQRDKGMYLTWSTCPTPHSFTLTGPRQFLIPVQLFRAWLFRPYFRLDTIHTSAYQRLNVFFLMAHTLVHPTVVALEFVSPSSFWHSDILDL